MTKVGDYYSGEPSYFVTNVFELLLKFGYPIGEKGLSFKVPFLMFAAILPDGTYKNEFLFTIGFFLSALKFLLLFPFEFLRPWDVDIC